MLGGSKTLAWGFAVEPHRSRILVLSYTTCIRISCLCFINANSCYLDPFEIEFKRYILWCIKNTKHFQASALQTKLWFNEQLSVFNTLPAKGICNIDETAIQFIDCAVKMHY